MIPGITTEARWMWYATPGDGDPLQGGSGAGEMLLFRVAVPAPSAPGLFAALALVAFRRRR